jgi:hypothetical protein
MLHVSAFLRPITSSPMPPSLALCLHSPPCSPSLALWSLQSRATMDAVAELHGRHLFPLLCSPSCTTACTTAFASSCSTSCTRSPRPILAGALCRRAYACRCAWLGHLGSTLAALSSPSGACGPWDDPPPLPHHRCAAGSPEQRAPDVPFFKITSRASYSNSTEVRGQSAKP